MADKKSEKNTKQADKKKVKTPKVSNNKHWFKDFKAELKKIIWPTRSQLVENTTVVISMVVIVAVIIFVLDLAFKSISGGVTTLVVNAKNEMTDSNTVEENVVEDEATYTDGDDEVTQISVDDGSEENGSEEENSESESAENTEETTQE